MMNGGSPTTQWQGKAMIDSVPETDQIRIRDRPDGSVINRAPVRGGPSDQLEPFVLRVARVHRDVLITTFEKCVAVDCSRPKA